MNSPAAEFSVLTPAGAAAVATVAVTGPRSWELVRRSFRPAGSPTLPPRPDYERVWFGRFGPPPGDEIVLAVRRREDGDCVELHCHGGPEVVRLMAEELRRLGDAPSRPAAHSLREAAEAELARAPTLRTAGILLDQVHGALGRALADLDAALARNDVTAAAGLTAELAGRTGLGRHLTRPWRVAVAGAPNVGKSSLVNAFAGFQRSVVTPLPGTTRDAVETPAAIDGWPIVLIDTAGRHETDDMLEGQGIARGTAAVAAADLCLWVLDGTAPPVRPAEPTANMLLVVNKTDLPPAWDYASIADAVTVSAKTGSGLAELIATMANRLVPEAPSAGVAVPFHDDLAGKVSLLQKAVASGDFPAAREVIAELAAPST
jgi:tRNA modification GTPase